MHNYQYNLILKDYYYYLIHSAQLINNSINYLINSHMIFLLDLE